ncbi:hypothetical protein ES703_102380 [subsurface metagenome]
MSGVNDTDVSILSLYLLQTEIAPRHFQHIAEGGDDDVRKVSQGNCLVQVSIGSNTNRTAGTGKHLNGRRQKLAYTILDNGGGVSPTEFHKSCRLCRAAMNSIEKSLAKLGIAVFRHEFHYSGKFLFVMADQFLQ